MSTRTLFQMFTTAIALTLSAAAVAATPTARLGTFEKDGQQFFALSLLPQLAADAAQKNEVVILVDTSASQAGRYRSEEIAAVQAILTSLSLEDRVQLMTLDMKATPMGAGFVSPQGTEMDSAMAKLNSRTPLGATDLEAGLRAAMKGLAKNDTAKTVIYIGDAVSKANVVTEASLRHLVNDLRTQHVSVSSYLVGQERNMHLMATLANHTGGVVATEKPDQLGASVRATVVWPKEAKLPQHVSASYPADMPPVRTDRDSILVGTLSKTAPVSVEMSGVVNGKEVRLSWNATPEKPSDDFAFLPKLVELASEDQGIWLPTAGSGALREAAYLTLNGAQDLVKLGHEALANGNYEGAEKVADAALARDPANPEAKAIKEAARKGKAAGRGQRKLDPELRMTALNTQPPTDAAVPPPPEGSSLLAEVLAEPPGFLGRVEEERRVLAGKMKAEVDNDLALARRTMATNPDQAEQDLKLTLERIERTPDLEPEMRAQLRRQVQSAVLIARQQKIVHEERVAAAQQRAAEAQEQERLNDALALTQQKIKQIVDRFDSLMKEQRYAVADEEIVPELQRLAPGTTVESSLTHSGRMIRANNEMEFQRTMKENMFLRTLYQVELSFVPFPDEPPIVYVPSDQWEDLTIRRQKYKAVDLGRRGGAEERIFSELNKPTSLDAIEMPLKDAMTFLADQHRIPIVISTKKLDEASVSPDTPITKQLRDVTLRSALRLILKDLELTYVVRDEVLQITTPEDAENQLITKVYPVADLAVPVGAGGMGMMGMGGMGMGMGGGGMGGMMNGMGGGMGGMGGGMGGMGGGMGGMGGGMMGGGMGGGMFAVEDELKLGPKKANEAIAPAATAKEPVAKEPEVQPARVKATKPSKRIELKLSEGETAASGWERYFASEEGRLGEMGEEQLKAATSELFASVRETARQLMDKKQYADVATMIEAALRHGQMQPWMYEALALALRADSIDKLNKGMKIDDAQTEALERAMLSAVDFAQDEDHLVLIAAYMAQAGLEQRALSLYQQISKTNPSRPEPYLQGLALARRLNDVAAIQWACVGVLSQAWGGNQRDLAEQAFRIGQATYEKLLADGKKAEAEAFDVAVRQAKQRDCVVIVTWTGDADVDVAVEEPSGTLVSQRQPRSTGGGVHLGDVSSADSKSKTKGYTEAYACPEGFAGEYKVLIKNVWGRPTSGKVTVDVYTNFGSEKQNLVHEQIPLADKNAVVTFKLAEGRRKESLPEAQVANVAKVQNAMNRAILAQQLNNSANSQAAQSFANSLSTANGAGFVPFFFRPGAVGYRPNITLIPSGATMIIPGSAVISADRRYVRVGPSPNFQDVTEVNTFNFVTGQGGTQGQGQGGVGGGGGGFGGGGIGGGGLL